MRPTSVLISCAAALTVIFPRAVLADYAFCYLDSHRGTNAYFTANIEVPSESKARSKFLYGDGSFVDAFEQHMERQTGERLSRNCHTEPLLVNLETRKSTFAYDKHHVQTGWSRGLPVATESNARTPVDSSGSSSITVESVDRGHWENLERRRIADQITMAQREVERLVAQEEARAKMRALAEIERKKRVARGNVQ